ncbi:MAG: DNA polymerase III subunit gamma/tau [Deltaproteobacteria bacterium]|nr:DNA polymerase III subunit gamma/tau [Deltaproteobacteria bacterium]
MSYLVLARKWRPQRFADVVGQDHVVHTLQNALNKGRIAHAFLFTGARGVGKTTAARLLAKALQCAQGPTAEPCGTCRACLDVTEGRAIDVLEIDGASNRGIDQVRELRDGVRYLPQAARFKIVIIDEVHMLTVEAFNALLKTLEEPPAHVKFIFATTEPHKIPITILSRCQRYDFKRIGPGDIAARLRAIAGTEKIEIDDEALRLIARAAQGSMRDGLSLLDQAVAYTDGEITAQVAIEALGVIDRRVVVEIVDAVLGRDPNAALEAVGRAFETGIDLRQLLGELAEEFRHLVVAQVVKRPEALIDLPERELAGVVERSRTVDGADLQRLFAMATEHVDALARAESPRLVLDVLVARMASMPPYLSLAELASLVERIAGGGGALPGSGHDGSPRGRTPTGGSDDLGRRGATAAPERPARPAAATSPRTAATAPATARPAGRCEVADEEYAAPCAPTLLPDIDPRWQSAVATVRSQHPALASFLEHGLVIGPRDETLVLRFEQTFYADAVRDQDNLKTVCAAVAEQFANVRRVQIEVGPIARHGSQVSIAEAEAKIAEQRRSTRESEALNSPTVKLAVEIFGGTVLQVKEA